MVYIHFILLTYTPEQMCLPHCTYMLANIVHIWTPHYFTYQLKNNKLQLLFTIIYCCIFANQSMSWHQRTMSTDHNQKCYHKHWYIYISHNQHMSLEICLPHSTNISNCTSTIVYTWTPYYHTHLSKAISCNIFTILLQNMYQQQICPSNATHMAYAQIAQHAFMGESMPIYRPHMKLLIINNVCRIAHHRWWWW